MPKKRKIFPKMTSKSLGRDISKYRYVEIEWVDIEGVDGWSTLSTLDKYILLVAVS